MKFSAQEEYGLRCLLCLARISPDESLTIPEISKLEGMSNSHVAKILAILRKGGYVNSTRGQLGGYTLADKPENMSIKNIMDLLGGRLFGDGFCERHSGVLNKCVHETDCAMNPLWTNIQSAVDAVTSKYTLADLLNRRIEEPLVHLSDPNERKLEHSS